MFSLEKLGALLDLVEIVKDKGPTVIDDVVRALTDAKDMFDSVQELFALESTPPVVTGPGGAHPFFKWFIKSRSTRRLAAETKRGATSIETVYDQNISDSKLAEVCSSCGISMPMVGSKIGDWFASVDWTKVFDIISKIMAILLPILLALDPVPTLAAKTAAMPMTREALIAFDSAYCKRLQAIRFGIVPDEVKKRAQAGLDAEIAHPETLDAVIALFQ